MPSGYGARNLHTELKWFLVGPLISRIVAVGIICPTRKGVLRLMILRVIHLVPLFFIVSGSMS